MATLGKTAACPSCSALGSHLTLSHPADGHGTQESEDSTCQTVRHVMENTTEADYLVQSQEPVLFREDLGGGTTVGLVCPAQGFAASAEATHTGTDFTSVALWNA